jgi:hypothetical protein
VLDRKLDAIDRGLWQRRRRLEVIDRCPLAIEHVELAIDRHRYERLVALRIVQLEQRQLRHVYARSVEAYAVALFAGLERDLEAAARHGRKAFAGLERAAGGKPRQRDEQSGSTDHLAGSFAMRRDTAASMNAK